MGEEAEEVEEAESGEVEKVGGFLLLLQLGWCGVAGRDEEIMGVRARSVRWVARWGWCAGRVAMVAG